MQLASTILVASVTEPSSDMALPHPIVASLRTWSPACEIIVPRNVVVVPRVASLPTTQGVYPVNPSLVVTDAALNQKLDGIATALSSAGMYEPSFDGLLAYAEASADSFGAISSAQQGGAFGFGNVDLLRHSLVIDSNSNVWYESPAGDEGFTLASSSSSTGSSGGSNTFAALDPTNTATLVQTSSQWTLWQSASSRTVDGGRKCRKLHAIRIRMTESATTTSSGPLSRPLINTEFRTCYSLPVRRPR